MKVLLFGKNSKNIEELVKSVGFEIVTSNPDIIVSYGGDGTLLSSEREYPNIPKLPIRNSQFCNKCPDHKDEVLLKNLLEDKLQLKEYGKLEAQYLDKTFLALNDFVIRNKQTIHAVRFQIHGKLFIGDGIVVSTSFGSSGYFKSITGESFENGFGLAFNNTTEKMEPEFFGSSDQLTFKLVRGNATLSFDNSPDIYVMPEGMELNFKLSNEVAKIYELESLRCPNCQINRG